MSSTHASLYLNLACRMSLAILRAPRASVSASGMSLIFSSNPTWS